MKNQFFRIALAQASRLAGKPGRLISLTVQLMQKLKKTHFSSAEWKEKFGLLSRLVKSYAKGHYRVIPLKSFLIVVAALLYFLNPFDLIPDAIIGLGLTDDLAVLTWVYKTLSEELNEYKRWEKQNTSVLERTS